MRSLHSEAGESASIKAKVDAGPRRFFHGGFLGWQFFERGEPFRGEAELLLPVVKRVRGIDQFFEQQADGGGIAALHDFFPPEKNLPDRVGFTFDGKLLVNRTNKLAEAVVDADDFLTFDHRADGYSRKVHGSAELN